MISRAHVSALVSISLAVGLGLAHAGCSSDSSAPDDSGSPATGTGGAGGTSAGGAGGSAGPGGSATGGKSAGGNSTGGTSAAGTGGTGTGGTSAGAGGSTGGAATGGTGGTPGGGSGGATAGGSGGAEQGGSGGAQAGSGGAAVASQKVKITNLVSDQTGMATLTDPNLINAWGLAWNPAGPLWVANNHSGTATVYDVATPATLPLVVAIPSPTAGTPGAPTGQIFNAAPADFMGDKFILSTEDGTIIGWAAGTTSVIRADSSAGGASYKGLASFTANAKSFLLAPDFHNAKVDVFDATYAPATLTGNFTDPSIPAGYGPYNVLVDGDKVYIAFAKQDSMMGDDEPGPGLGYVSQFDTTGALVKSLIAGGDLNAPWGLAIAPANFGTIGGSLLVGNFGDGGIHAYDLTSGAEVATLTDETGAPLDVPGLWSLTFGLGTTGADKNQLFVSAGPGDENHGLIGRIDAL